MFKKIIYFILPVLLLLFVHFRGLSFPDEGYILHSAQRILQGDILYKDFFMVYMPGSTYAAALSFLLFGQSILAGRLFAFILSLLTTWGIFLLLQRATKNNIASYLATLAYVAWGPSHINYIWPTMLSITTSIFCLLFLLKAIELEKLKYYFLTGIALGLTIITKQNFAVALLITVLFALIQTKKVTVKQIKGISAGVFIPIIVFLLSLISTNSFNSFWENIYFYTIKGIILGNIYTTPFIHGDTNIENALNVIGYLFPLLISIISFIFLYYKQSRYSYVPLFVILFYIFSIRPTPDYVHIVPILSLLGLPIAFLVSIKNKFKNMHIALFVVFIAAGFYSAIFKGFYRWETPLIHKGWTTPLIKNSIFSNSPSSLIFVDKSHEKSIRELSVFFQKNALKNEYVFVNYYSPMMYFITNTKNPTKFEIIDQSSFYKPYQDEVIQNLQEKNVRFIISYEKNNGSFLEEFIKENYNLTFTTGDITVWQKKNN
jgi:4-amino-4-deoxy-L-arabinose transferase-like glycosyltransferase